MGCWYGSSLADSQSNFRIVRWLNCGTYIYGALAVIYLVLAVVRSICIRIDAADLLFDVRAPFVRILGMVIALAGLQLVVTDGIFDLLILGIVVMVTPAFVAWHKKTDQS